MREGMVRHLSREDLLGRPARVSHARGVLAGGAAQAEGSLGVGAFRARADEGTGSQETSGGATFDGLLDMLARQHRSEVAQLRSELGCAQQRAAELALARGARLPRPRNNSPLRAAAAGPRPSCPSPPAPESPRPPEEDAPRIPCRSEPVRAARAPRDSDDSADCTAGALPGTLDAARRSSGGDSLEDVTKAASGGDEEAVVTEGSRATLAGPTDFELLEAWRVAAVQPKSHWSRSYTLTSSLHNPNRSGILAAHRLTRGSVAAPFGDSAWLPLLFAQPTSPSRVAWHAFGACLILYDLFKLPVEHAFRPDETGFSRSMDWIILLYWTLNMPASLTEGYLERGLVVLSPRRIWMKYMRTWFFVDALVLVPDWTFTVGSLLGNGEDHDSKALTRFLNVARLARIVRLIRLLKLRRILDTLNDMTTSEHTSLLLNILVMIVMVLVISHQIGCAWFAIGDNQGDDTPSWTNNPEVAHSSDMVYMYATSVHWSVAQFTPATIEVSPENLGERIFAIFVVIFALLCFSYIVGSITGSLAQLRSMHAEESTLFWDLRRYLAKNRVSRALSLRIQKYLEYAWHLQQERKPAKSIRLMALLSEQLFSELQCELAVAQLRVHPFLAKLCETSSVTVQRLANSAISHKLVASGDFLFYPGESATHLWIVVEGSSEYSRVDASGSVRRELVNNNEDWIAEPVLWTRWVHRGLLTALEDGDDLAIEGKRFCELVRLNPKAHTFASKYAHNFIRWLNDQDPDDLTDVSQGEDVGALIAEFMEQEPDYGRRSDEGADMLVSHTSSHKSVMSGQSHLK